VGPIHFGKASLQEPSSSRMLHEQRRVSMETRVSNWLPRKNSPFGGIPNSLQCWNTGGGDVTCGNPVDLIGLTIPTQFPICMQVSPTSRPKVAGACGRCHGGRRPLYVRHSVQGVAELFRLPVNTCSIVIGCRHGVLHKPWWYLFSTGQDISHC
jgi:hypothetical protein